MFDIGFWELLLIGIVALLVLGPERLPTAIRATSRTLSQIRSTANHFKHEMNHQLKMHELHENLKKAEEKGLENLSPELQESVDELKDAAASVKRPYKNDTNV